MTRSFVALAWLLLAAAPGCRHSAQSLPDDLQPLDRLASLPSDSRVFERLAKAHPCASSMPAVARLSDSISAERRCVLFATAVAAIQEGWRLPENKPLLGTFPFDRVGCVSFREEAYRNRVTQRIELARWSVGLLSDSLPPIVVEIDRQSGTARLLTTEPLTLPVSPRGATSLAFSVTDQDRRPIEGAVIWVISGRADTTRRSSDRSGEATFDNLPPGRYRIIVRRLGLKPAQRDVELPAQCRRKVAVRLRGFACDLVPDCVDAPSEMVVGDCHGAGRTD